MYLRKDRSLDRLAVSGNIAQFVSFTPSSRGPEQAYLRVIGREPNQHFSTSREAVNALLNSALEGKVNVRSYEPESPRSREFVYGLDSVDQVMATLDRLTSEGLHTIVNETVNIADGGVSGVVQGGIIEFAPDDTPRCVEKAGTASLALELGLRLIEIVYGFRPDLGDGGGRTEFSIHPRPCGWRGTRTLLWEHEEDESQVEEASPKWPNLFSRHIGDKAYGLLMAHLAGQLVPDTLVISRRIAPFRFGSDTNSNETWLRTCPVEQVPGLFTTHRGWLDPFRLIAEEDPTGTQIASVLAQAGVRARHSGASIVDAEDHTVVEGVDGVGDAFMVGVRAAETLPTEVIADVAAVSDSLRATFGPVRTEWAHDGEKIWVLQLHRGATLSTSRVLVPGDRDRWIDFEISRGLEKLRSLLASVEPDTGLRLVGDVGMTSHIADVVRKSGVPTRVLAA